MEKIGYLKLRGSLINEWEHYNSLINKLNRRTNHLKWLNDAPLSAYEAMVDTLEDIVNRLDTVDLSEPVTIGDLQLEDYLNLQGKCGNVVVVVDGRCFVITEDVGTGSEFKFIEVVGFLEKSK